MSREKFRKIWSVITLVLILAVASALIVSCVGIYRSGQRPYSRQAMADAAGTVAIPGTACLAAVLIGLFLDSAEKDKPVRGERDLLARYGVHPQGEKERALRKKVRVAAAAVIGALYVYPVIYFCDVTHFSIAELSRDIILAVLAALIPTAVAFVIAYICGHILSRSISREIEAYKDAGIKPGKAPEKHNTDPSKRRILRVVLAAAAIVFILLGISNGGAADVLGKAIRICTECIGLG